MPYAETAWPKGQHYASGDHELLLDVLRCSFCGKSVPECRFLVPGPEDIGICDECVDRCVKYRVDEFEAYPEYFQDKLRRLVQPLVPA